MNERLNIQDFIDLLAEKHGMDKQDADGFVKEFFLLIEEALESDRYVKIKGLGTFKLIEVDSRESVKVNTGERFQIDGHTKVSFTPDSTLREVINKPFSHFETVILNENTVLEDTPMDELEEEVVTEETVAEECPLPTAEEIIAAELLHSDATFKQRTPEEPQSQPVSTQPTQPIQPVQPLQSTQSVQKSPVAYLITIILLVLLLCGSALIFIYYPDLFTAADRKELVQTPLPLPAIQVEIPLDTIIATKDTVAEVMVEKTEVEAPVKTEVQVTKKTATPVKPDSVTYKITGTKTTYTVKAGETLTRVSLRFYGTKNLWPYIVQHNRDVIKNPDNVPYGTTLKIPELVKR